MKTTKLFFALAVAMLLGHVQAKTIKFIAIGATADKIERILKDKL